MGTADGFQASPVDARAYLNWLSVREQEMIDYLGALVNLDTPSSRKDLLDRAMLMVEEVCGSLGAKCVRSVQVEAGDHLIARWPGRNSSASVLLLAHLDTVWPAGEALHRPFRSSGDRLTGPGIFDMKAGLVQALYAIQALQEVAAVSGPVTLLVTSDEETGSRSSRELIEVEARRADAVLVVEPAAGGKLKTARKGVGVYRVEALGRASHAGLDPEKGRSAILELAHQIVRLHQLNDAERGTSVTVGMVTGGSARNVVPARAEATVDLRVVTAQEAERVDSRIHSLEPVSPGTRVVVTGGINRPPMERGSATARLFARAQAIAAQLGETLGETLVGGGSDGNFTAALGVPTLDGLGAVGGGAHALDEHIDRPSLVRRSALLAGLLEDLAARPASRER